MKESCALTCFLIGGIASIIYFLVLYNLTKRARKWPTTIGQIIDSELVSFGAANARYRAVIRYEYQINGKSYVSKRLNYGYLISTSSLSYAQKKVKLYFPGRKCTVYYDPLRPQRSVLETSLNLPLYLLLFSGIFLVLFSVIFLIR